MLDALETAVSQSVHAYVDHWIANPTMDYLENAEEGLSDVLEVTRGWPPSKDVFGRGVYASMTRFVDDVHETLTSFQSKVEEGRAAIDEQIQAATTKRTELSNASDQQLVELQGKIQAAKDTLDQFVDTGTQLENRLEEALRAHQQSFTVSEAERQQSHLQAMQSERSSFDSTMNELSEASREALTKQKEDGAGILVQLNELETQARDVVGAVATASTSTGYGIYADEQRNTANVLRLVAIGLFLSAFAIIGYSVYLAETGDDSWKVTVLKAATSVTMLAAAAYVARESTRHRNEEIQARNTQLKLVALDPFIANLEKVDRESIKMAAAQDLFTSLNTHVETLSNIDEEDDESAPSAT